MYWKNTRMLITVTSHTRLHVSVLQRINTVSTKP